MKRRGHWPGCYENRNDNMTTQLITPISLWRTTRKRRVAHFKGFVLKSSWIFNLHKMCIGGLYTCRYSVNEIIQTTCGLSFIRVTTLADTQWIVRMCIQASRRMASRNFSLYSQSQNISNYGYRSEGAAQNMEAAAVAGIYFMAVYGGESISECKQNKT